MEDIHEVSPPGFEGTVKAMKKHKEIDNPYALAWHMKNNGYKSHKKKDGTNKMKNESLQNQIDALKFTSSALNKRIEDKEKQARKEAIEAERKEREKKRKELYQQATERALSNGSRYNQQSLEIAQNMVGRDLPTGDSTDSLAQRVEIASKRRMQRAAAARASRERRQRAAAARASRESMMANTKGEGYISFSNFISEAEKELPKCPEGYKYNRDTMRCEPKKDSDDVRGKMNKSGGSSTGFTGKVIGSHGQNGAPPAYGEKSSGKGLYMSRDGDMGTSGWHDQFSGGLGSNPMGTA